MNFVIFVLYIVVLSLSCLFVYARVKDYRRVLSFKNSILTIILLNLSLIFANSNVNFVIVHLAKTFFPFLLAFSYANLYFDFNNATSIVEKTSKKYLIMRLISFILMFVLFVEIIRMLLGDSIVEMNFDIVDFGSLNVTIHLILILFMALMILNMLYANIKCYYRDKSQGNIANIISIILVQIILLLRIALGEAHLDSSFSGFLLLYLLLNFIVNLDRSEKIINNTQESILPCSEIIVRNRRSTDKQKHDSAVIDSLTGLYNDEYFRQQLKDVDIILVPVVVVYIGISGLKLINETYGYEQGDEVLQEVSIILNDVFDNSVIARLNGSNYGILLTNTNKQVVEKRIVEFISICSSRDGLIINASFGLADSVTEEKEALELLSVARENHYWNKSRSSAKNQDRTADILFKNLSRNYLDISEHLKRCSEMSVQFGEYLSLEVEEIKDLRNIALLHDISITMIPRVIVYQADFLDAYERKIYRNHVLKGFDIVLESGMNMNVANGILHHHENYNGTGYPHGLKKDKIPYLSQIISIIDCVDMTIYFTNSSDELERILLTKIGVEFSEKLVYNMIDFLKGRKII